MSLEAVVGNESAEPVRTGVVRAGHLEEQRRPRALAADTPLSLADGPRVVPGIDSGDATAAEGADDPLECAVCGETVPRAIYREHLLKACPGAE